MKRNIVLVCSFCLSLVFADCLLAEPREPIVLETDVRGDIIGNYHNPNTSVLENLYIPEAPDSFGDTDGNELIIFASTRKSVKGNVYGAMGENGSLSNNRVVVGENVEVEGFVYGGYAVRQGTVSGNTVLQRRANLSRGCLRYKLILSIKKQSSIAMP
jgi:hypothetical protein